MNLPAKHLISPHLLLQPWQQVLPALLLLLGGILFLYRDTVVAMMTIWSRSETFTHGFMVPPLVLWLVWRQRAALAAQVPQPSAWGLLPVAGAAFLWLLGELVAVNAVTQLALTLLLVLAVWTVLGLGVTRSIMFPLGFLFFAVPVGEFLMPQLMDWTANFTVLALRLSGIPVYREGLQFVIPTGNWSVVEACSGVRYLIASLMVGTLFAYLNYRSNKRRLIFVAVSLVVPILANWMRAYLIVMLGHLSGNKIAAGVDHLIYGWLFFGVVIMLMFIIGGRWAEPESLAGASVNVSVNASATGSPAPQQTVTAPKLWAITLGLAALLTLPHLTLWAIERSEGAGPVALTAPIALAGNWQTVRPGVADFKPAFQNPTAEINASYASQGRTVGLYLGYYRHQNYSRKLVSSANVLAVSNNPQWAQVSSASRFVTLAGNPVAMRTAELRGTPLAGQGEPNRLVVRQIYWINGTLTANDYVAKIYSALYRLMGRGDDSAVIIIYTQKDQLGGAEAVLDAFFSSNYAAIDELLLKQRQ